MDELVKSFKKLSFEEKIAFCDHVFQVESDNDGQFVAYTGITQNDDGTYREMTNEDFDQEND